jgi:hypothetical protein
LTATLISNRISLDIPDDDMQAIRAALQVLQDKLLPHLVDLSADDRRALPKMGAKTVDFVAKALSYTRANPQYKPAFVDVDELARDLAAVGSLRELQQPLDQIAALVDASLLLSGSEAYAAALACYQSFKAAAKLHMPGAGTIANDLSERFPGRPVKRAAPVAPVAGQPVQTGVGA